MNPAMAKLSLCGDPYCGHETACWKRGGKITLCIVDGLGHGEHAEKAAKAAAIIGDWGLETDDSAVLVYRYGGPS